MYLLILFFSELFILFLLSRSVTRGLSSFIYHHTKSKRITVFLLAFLFFPGTLIHELSHYIAAKVLFVRTYGMELIPKLDGENLKLGSVSLEKPDFLRHLLIGMAPFLIGTTILLSILYCAVDKQLFNNTFFIVIIGYLVFEIGNTMFSSKKDMEGAIELLLILIILGGGLYISGINFPFLDPTIILEKPIIEQLFEKGSLFLLAPIGIDLLIISVLKLTSYRHSGRVQNRS
jgi:hypothetical protein